MSIDIRSTLHGLASGFLLTLAVLFVLARAGFIEVTLGAAPRLESLVRWLVENFGSALFVFATLILVFWALLQRLHETLERGSADDALEVHMLEQRIDMVITLFFGTGVIYTAVGMRNALLFALGGDTALAESGAEEVLKNLVEGGILVALSTTILGGIGGYVMRVLKIWQTGPALLRFRAAQQRENLRELILEIQATPKAS